MLNFYKSFFYINICGFIGRDKFLYETRVLDNSYRRCKFQLTNSDSTQITAGGPKVPIEGGVPIHPSGRNIILNASTLPYLIVILVSTFYLLYFPRY